MFKNIVWLYLSKNYIMLMVFSSRVPVQKISMSSMYLLNNAIRSLLFIFPQFFTKPSMKALNMLALVGAYHVPIAIPTSWIYTGKTLGKLHWKSKIPLEKNGIAAILKK